MKLDPKVRSKLDAARFEDVDDLWIARLEEAPRDVEFFAPVVRALLQREQDARAAMLVQLWLDEQRQGSDVQQELQQLRALLKVWPQSQELREALVDATRRRYRDHPSLETLIERFGLAEAAEPERALQGMETWLRFDVGQLVAMPKRGVGRVTSMNLALGTLRVEFPDTQESFRLGEAEQLLEPLDPDHFLARKALAREELEALVDSNAGELLRLLFASLGSPLPLATVREHLRDLMPAASWNTWWKRARSDGRLNVGSGARATCTWSDSVAAAQDQLLDEFERASDHDKLDMVRQHAGRSHEVQQTLETGLVHLLEKGPDEPAVALEAALLLDELHETDTTTDNGAFGSWDAAGTRKYLEEVLSHADASERIAALRDRRARERAIGVACAVRSDPWPLLEDLTRHESDARTLAAVYARMREHDRDGALDDSIQRTLRAPHQTPRWYVWLCRELGRNRELPACIDWRFLRALLDACDSETLRPQRAALRELFDPGGLVVRSAESLERGQAEQLLRILGREMGVEEYRKDNVRRAVLERFPELAERDEDDEVLYVTAEALERKRAEFEQLVRVEIPRNTEEIRKAAAHGDLRENFEYKSARERQEMLSSRAKSMHEELRRARALDPASIDASVVRVGTRVQLNACGDGAGRTLTILGPWDSDPASGILSYLAPAVDVLLGKGVGERVQFADAEYDIAAIEVWTR